MSLEMIIEYELILVFKKMKDGQIRHNFTIEMNSFIHSYTTRSRNNFRVPNFNTKHGEIRFIVRSTKLFNSLPSEIQNIINLQIFKKQIKNYLFQKFLIT